MGCLKFPGGTDILSVKSRSDKWRKAPWRHGANGAQMSDLLKNEIETLPKQCSREKKRPFGCFGRPDSFAGNLIKCPDLSNIDIIVTSVHTA